MDVSGPLVAGVVALALTVTMYRLPIRWSWNAALVIAVLLIGFSSLLISVLDAETADVVMTLSVIIGYLLWRLLYKSLNRQILQKEV